jgi:plastocyanin
MPDRATSPVRFFERSVGRLRLLALVLLLVTSALMTACVSDRPSTTEGPDSPQPGPDGVVEIRLTANLRFEPGDIVIPRGTPVRWVNAAAVFHTVTPDIATQPGVWNPRAMNTSGETFTHTFNEAGQTYTYHCEPHRSAGMTGRIRIQ